MEWLVLAVVAALAALFVAWPRPGDRAPEVGDAAADLLARRDSLLVELREIDDDFATGRITEGDRAQARRALGPRLRAVTEALRDLGEDVR
ncbi:MAG: hypothetical protein Q7K37_10410 [Dehalococcoidia bacterium]|nr:hypothetical protein [Dehalococcoidia bacterium]